MMGRSRQHFADIKIATLTAACQLYRRSHGLTLVTSVSCLTKSAA